MLYCVSCFTIGLLVVGKWVIYEVSTNQELVYLGQSSQKYLSLSFHLSHKSV